MGEASDSGALSGGTRSRRGERSFRLLAESVPQLVWAVAPGGELEFVNRRWIEHTGLSLSATRGEARAKSIHPDDRAAFQADWERGLAAVAPFEVRFRLRRAADGAWRWFHGRAEPVHDEAGHLLRWIFTAADANDSGADSRNAVRESEARLRQFADALPQIVWTARPDGYFDWYNRRWYEFTGFAPGQGGDASWEPILHPDDVGKCHEVWYEAVRTGQPYSIEYRFKDSATGDYRWHLGRALPVCDTGGRIVKWLGICTDIDDQKRAEEGLREADRRKDEFLAMLAHELRNPLAPIRNAVEVLRLLVPGGAEAEWVRDIIARQVAHLSRLTDDLLDVARIARGKILVRRERLNLVPVVRAAVEDFRPLLEATGLQFATEYPTGPLWLRGDATRLTQAVGNLLHNAKKFTRAGGRVAVGLREEAGVAVLSVRDSGIGMDPDTLRRIFDAFTQADRTLDRGQGGLGLGLALVKGLAKLHGGTVAAYSDGLGRGSLFEIRLPLEDGAPEAPQPRPPASPPPAAVNRVLVVEDNRDAAESLVLLLRLWGHEVEVAHTGPEGIDAARRFGPGVVLCDVGLPGGLDGYAVARALRAEPQLAATRLIALTGYGQEDDQKRSREAGFDVHLTKPVDPAALREWLTAP